MFRFVSCILLAALLLLFSASTLPAFDVSDTDCTDQSPRSDSEAVHERILAQSERLTGSEHHQSQEHEHIDQVIGTFLCSRTSDENDAALLKIQRLLHHLLDSLTPNKYPVVVFICPGTSSAHRSLLKEQGAIVRELDIDISLAPFYTDDLPKLKDQLRMLSLWSATEYGQILFVNPAATIHNIDHLLDDALPQQCDMTKMLEESSSWSLAMPKSELENFCRYTFKLFQAGSKTRSEDSMFILSPNRLMYRRLIEYAQRPESFAALRMGMVQAVQDVAFRHGGPFPAQYLKVIERSEVLQSNPIVPDSRWRIVGLIQTLWQS